MGKEWVKLEKIGQLYLEKILVSFDVPILFVCSDFEKKIYVAEYDFESCLITTSVFMADTFDSSLLPEEGAFFEIVNKEISEYISALKGQLGSVCQGYYYPQSLKVERLYGSSYFKIGKEEVFKSKSVIVSDVKESGNYNIRIPKKLIA